MIGEIYQHSIIICHKDPKGKEFPEEAIERMALDAAESITEEVLKDDYCGNVIGLLTFTKMPDYSLLGHIIEGFMECGLFAIATPIYALWHNGEYMKDAMMITVFDAMMHSAMKDEFSFDALLKGSCPFVYHKEMGVEDEETIANLQINIDTGDYEPGPVNTLSDTEVNDLIVDFLHSIGCDESRNGFFLIWYAIKRYLIDPNFIHNITDDLYGEYMRFAHTTYAASERGLRYIISVIFNPTKNGKYHKLMEIFGNVNYKGDFPQNGKFINVINYEARKQIMQHGRIIPKLLDVNTVTYRPGPRRSNKEQ